jgi:hypothetical protein
MFNNAYVAATGLKRRGFDVPSAYLKGEALEEVVYMRPPPGYACAAGTVWRLLRPLYGVKQAMRAWACSLRKKLESWHVLSADADCTLYIKEVSDGPVLMATNVDDLDLAGSDRDMDPVEARLRAKFNVKHTADDAPFVGMQRVANPITGAITIHQQLYAEELLVEFGMTQAKPVHTTSESGVELRRDAPGDMALPPAVLFAQVVGKRMFLAGCTHPNIMQPVAALARHQAIPRESHWRAAKHLLRYLHGTTGLGLRYHGPKVNVTDGSATGELHIEGLTDANYAGCKDTLRSTTGQVFHMQGAAVLWSNTLQPTVAQSTTKAEYMAAAAAFKEALWHRKLRSNMLLDTEGPTQLWGDKQGALALVKDPVLHACTKQIDVHRHAVRERVVCKEVVFDLCPTSDPITDAMTKGLPRPAFEKCREGMGLVFL